MFIEAKLFKKAGEGSGGGGGGDSHNLGYYETPEALRTAHPTATAGDFAIVNSTDTVWLWDTDTSAWKDGDTKGQVTSVNNQTGAVTIGANDVLPTQTGYSGRVLGTDGFVAGWVKPEIVQCSALPTASEEEVDKIYQYVGTTDANYTNGYFYKCVSDGQTPATYSWTRVDVQPTPSELPSQSGNSGKFLTTDGTNPSWATVGGLPSQTGQSGKFLTTDGTDASWGTISALQNTATAIDSVTVAGTAATQGGNCVNVGVGSSVEFGGTAVGKGASAKNASVAVGATASAISSGTAVGQGAKANANGAAFGQNAQATGNTATAIGRSANATAQCAIQIGPWINSTADTMCVGFSSANYQLLAANGTIPADRLASTTGLADGNYRLRLTIASGVPTLSWVAE